MAVDEDNVFTEDDVLTPTNVSFVPEDKSAHYYNPRPVLFDPFCKEIKLIIPIPVLLSFVDEYNAPSPNPELLTPIILFKSEFNPIAVLWLPVVLTSNEFVPTEVFCCPLVIAFEDWYPILKFELFVVKLILPPQLILELNVLVPVQIFVNGSPW